MKAIEQCYQVVPVITQSVSKFEDETHACEFQITATRHAQLSVPNFQVWMQSRLQSPRYPCPAERENEDLRFPVPLDKGNEGSGDEIGLNETLCVTIRLKATEQYS